MARTTKTTKKQAKASETPIPYKPNGPRALADVGLTPARAWALHRYVAQADADVPGTVVHGGLRAEAIRIIHESFGCIVAFVANDIEGDDDGGRTGNILVGATTKEGRFVWRTIGYVWPDGRFTDFVDILAANFVSPRTDGMVAS